MKILKVVSKPSSENENAEHCLAIMGANQALRKVSWFDEDRWLSFCVLKKALQFKREVKSEDNLSAAYCID